MRHFMVYDGKKHRVGLGIIQSNKAGHGCLTPGPTASTFGYCIHACNLFRLTSEGEDAKVDVTLAAGDAFLNPARDSRADDV
jgi:hypothetical protein